MYKRLRIGVVAIISTFILGACSSPGGSTTSSGNGTEIGDKFLIGYDLEMSGAVAAYGTAEKQGADLAVEEINADGGINGKQIEVIAKDNKSDNAEAATIASNLTVNNKVNAIIGTATSGAAKSIIPNITKAKVPMVTPSGTDDTLTVQDGKVQKYVFRSIFPDSYQGTVISDFVTDELDAKKIVLFTDNSSDYAKGITKTFKKNYKGEIVNEQTFVSGDKDFQAQLTKIKSEEFDAIVMPGYYNETGLITKQARDMGITAPIVGGDGYSDSKYVETAGATGATNVYYVSGYSEKAPATDKVAPFVEAFKAKYGESPSAFSALAYDAVYMIKEAAENGKVKNSDELAEELAKLEDFVGVTGEITIDEEHNPIKSAVIVGLKDGKEDTAKIIAPSK